MIFTNPVFLRSCWTVTENDNKVIAFAGRSNVGKSSVINTLCNGRFARVAKKPGRTRMINLFKLNSGALLADLPGYGYASVSYTESAQWHEKISIFLCSQSLSLVVVVIDCRRGIGEKDEILLSIIKHVPLLVLLNKSDKLGRSKFRQCMDDTRLRLTDHAAPLIVLPFSALKKTGVEDAQQAIEQLLYKLAARANNKNNGD